MKLTIDQIPCDLDPSQRIALDYDAQDLADVRSGNKGHALRLRLPATRTNDRIFGFAAEPYTGQRFNAAQHTAVLSDGEAKLLQGSVRLLSAAYDSDPEGYLIEIRSGTSEWARQAAAEMFNTLGISFSGRLTPTMIRQTWTNNTPVKFFPVCRDEYTPELSSVELIPVERFLSVDDYHPFISAATVVQTLFSEAGYTLESDFLNGEFFRSLYLSGAYSSRDTNALRNHMDFLARRTTTAATTANSDGRVYANPYKSINSVGNFVETVNPNDQNDLGETLTDVFSNNHCFTVEDGEIVFRPMTSVTVAFEYHIRYITDHRILDRNRLKGIDSFYLGDGTEVQGALANRYADRRNSTKPAFQYRAIVFNHTEGNSYRLTCTVNGTAGHAIGEFDSRSALVTTPSGSTVTAPVLLCKAAGSTTYTTYTGDWALYDGYIGETGQTEVEMTVRTNPVTVTPTSPKTFSTIYFYGAEPGMKFSLSRQCTLRPDFTGAPGLNTPISFEDVARHRVRKWVVLDALRHLFNLRFYTDEETRTVYVEPADDFYRLGQTFDWSSRIDRSQPILLGDAAQDAERVRIYKYREADGAVTRLNATLEEPFGQWRLVNDSAAAIDRERSLANPFFSPTVSETECYADAPSALVLRVGDRDAPDTADRNSFTPRIVRYCGMQPLPAGERWGYPSTGDSYPLAAFHRNDPDNGFTLCFEDRDGQQGLHRFYDTQAEQEKRCQHLTLHLRLEPCDIERLFQIQRLAPCIASAVGTLVMAFAANKPFAMAPGMGLNSFFAVVVANIVTLTGMSYLQSFQTALCVILIEGIVFIILSVLKVREKIVEAIPLGVRYGIAPAIGLMLMNIGVGSNVGVYAEGNGYTDPFYVMRDFFGAMTPSTIRDQMGQEYSQMVLSVITMFVGLFVIVLLAKKGKKSAVLVGMLSGSIIYWAGEAIFLHINPFASLKGASFLPHFKDMAEVTLFKFDFHDFFQIGNILSHVLKHTDDLRDQFALVSFGVELHALHQALEICGFFRKRHRKISFPAVCLSLTFGLTLDSAQIFARAGVDLDLFALVDEQGNLDLRARLDGRGLGDVGSGVALDARIGLGNGQLDEVRRFDAEDVALVAQELDRGVFLDELEGVVEHILADGNHVVRLLIHEVVQIAVVVAVLIILALDESLFELCSRVERGLGHGAGHDVLHLRADECGALAGLDVLELHDLHDLAVHLKCFTVSEIASGNSSHKNIPPIYV